MQKEHKLTEWKLPDHVCFSIEDILKNHDEPDEDYYYYTLPYRCRLNDTYTFGIEKGLKIRLTPGDNTYQYKISSRDGKDVLELRSNNHYESEGTASAIIKASRFMGCKMVYLPESLLEHLKLL